MIWALQILLLLLVPLLANAATVYVSAGSGDDSTSGESWLEAKQTIRCGSLSLLYIGIPPVWDRAAACTHPVAEPPEIVITFETMHLLQESEK